MTENILFIVIIAILIVAVVVLAVINSKKTPKNNTAETEKLQSVIDEKNALIESKTKENESLQKEVAELNKSNGILIKTEENFKELQEKFAKTEQERNVLQIENMRFRENMNKYKDYDEITEQRDEYKLRLQSLEVQNRNLLSEKERLDKELEKVKQELEIKEKDIQQKYKQLTEQASILGKQQDYEEIKQKLSDTNLNLQNTQLQLKEAQSKLESEQEKIKDLEEKYAAYKKDYEELQKKFKNDITQITNDILKAKSEEFSKINKDSLRLILEPFEKEITSFKKTSKENLDDILKPFKTQIENFQKEIKDNTTAQTKNEATFKSHIENMMKETNKISQEADNLVNALKGSRRNNKSIGNWGENTLENILQFSGLIKGISYEAQESFSVTDENGITKKQIPDFVVYIPTDKGHNSECIIIDSKVSIEAYINYCNAETEEEKSNYLHSHIESIRRHIKGLSPKNYEKLPKVKNIDYVMMFIPLEPAYILAMNNAPELWKEAYDKKILLMSPTNIIASLKLISLLWNINARNDSAEKIAKLGYELYEKLATFTEKFVKIGKSLDSAKLTFDDAKKNLTNERQGLLKKAEGFKKYGISPKKNIPEIEDTEMLQIEENI